MQGHYLTHFAAMLQIKLNVFSCTFYRTFTMGVKGRKHADRAFIRGWGWGLIIGCIFYLQVNLFITGAYGGGGGLISGGLPHYRNVFLFRFSFTVSRSPKTGRGACARQIGC